MGQWTLTPGHRTHDLKYSGPPPGDASFYFTRDSHHYIMLVVSGKAKVILKMRPLLSKASKWPWLNIYCNTIFTYKNLSHAVKWGDFDKQGDFDNCCYFIKTDI